MSGDDTATDKGDRGSDTVFHRVVRYFLTTPAARQRRAETSVDPAASEDGPPGQP